MKVETQHRQYLENQDLWQTCRDVFAGERAIKAAGTRYLPRVSERQRSEDYAAYKSRALFYNATARTVGGLLGFVFRKPPAVEFPEAIKDQLADATLSGVPFPAFAKSVFQKVLLVGRHGVLLDLPAGGNPANRPYVCTYTAEMITNWATSRRGGNTILSMVVLHETREEPAPADPFERKSFDQYRVLALDPDGFYEVSIWRKAEERAKEYEVVEQYQPVMRGERLDFIPFVFFSPNGTSPDVERSPIADLVDVNLSHYRSSADLEHSRHFCSTPVFFFSGFDSDDPIVIGASQGIVSKNENAKVSFVEFTGAGLSEQRLALEEKSAMMAALGARLLEPTKRAAEAAETLQIRQSGESSTLKSMAQSVGHGLSRLLSWWASWANATGLAVCSLNADFVDTPMSASEMNALMALWQSGGISYSTLYSNLERGEVARPGITAEQERHEAAAEGVL